MAVVATLAALLLAQPPATPERWACEHSLDGATGVLDVTRYLDPDGRALYDYVRWSPRPRLGTRAVQWERLDPVGSARLPWTLRGDAVVAQLNLARAARRPVWLVMRMDGRVVARRLLLREMSDLSEYDRQTLEIGAEFRTDPPGAGPIPDFVNAAGIVLTAEEEGGATLARSSIRLPPREFVSRVIAQAAPALSAAAADYRTQCREIGAPPQ